MFKKSSHKYRRNKIFEIQRKKRIGTFEGQSIQKGGSDISRFVKNFISKIKNNQKI